MLVVGDAVVAAIAARVGAATPGVVRLHELGWRPTPRLRGRGRGTEVERHGDRVVVTLRLVLDSEHPVIDVVRTVQRSVGAEVGRLTGLVPDVTVVVVDRE